MSFQNNDVRGPKQDSPKSASASPRSEKSADAEDKPEGAVGTDPTPPPSQAASKQTTFDDLMATLHKLEADEKFPSARNHHKNENPACWCKYTPSFVIFKA